MGQFTRDGTMLAYACGRRTTYVYWNTRTDGQPAAALLVRLADDHYRLLPAMRLEARNRADPHDYPRFDSLAAAKAACVVMYGR